VRRVPTAAHHFAALAMRRIRDKRPPSAKTHSAAAAPKTASRADASIPAFKGAFMIAIRGLTAVALAAVT